MARLPFLFFVGGVCVGKFNLRQMERENKKMVGFHLSSIKPTRAFLKTSNCSGCVGNNQFIDETSIEYFVGGDN